MRLKRKYSAYYMEAGEVPEPSAGFEARNYQRLLIHSDERQDQPGYRRVLVPLLSAAAGLLILAGSYFFFVHRAEPEDTFTDPEIAYAETMKILMDVSSQMNHGTQSS